MYFRLKGFSLIELMIVITIIGVLAAIAIPSYQQYLIRSRLSEAFVGVVAVQKKIAEYVQINGEYPRDGADIGLPATPQELIDAPVIPTGTDEETKTFRYYVFGEGVAVITKTDTALGDASNKLILFAAVSPSSSSWACYGTNGNNIVIPGRGEEPPTPMDLSAFVHVRFLPGNCGSYEDFFNQMMSESPSPPAEEPPA